jgi:flagellar basal-body rod modification protein FlgD
MSDFLTISQTGRPAATPVTDRRNDDLGQKDFLTLMAAQLQNQDPFKPMENGAFLGQMAQFSTVNGIERLNETMAGVGAQIAAQRLAAGSGMIGQQVLVPGTRARPDSNGEIHGMIDLPEPASQVSVFLRDMAGDLLHEIALGPQGPGQVPFAWTDVPASMAQSRAQIRVEVQADTLMPPTPMVFARVQAVQMPPRSGDLMFTLEDYGQLSSLEVSALR